MQKVCTYTAKKLIRILKSSRLNNKYKIKTNIRTKLIKEIKGNLFLGTLHKKKNGIDKPKTVNTNANPNREELIRKAKIIVSKNSNKPLKQKISF